MSYLYVHVVEQVVCLIWVTRSVEGISSNTGRTWPWWRSRMHRMQDAFRTHQTNSNVSNAALEHKGSCESKQPRKWPSRPIINIGFIQYSDVATLDLKPCLHRIYWHPIWYSENALSPSGYWGTLKIGACCYPSFYLLSSRNYLGVYPQIRKIQHSSDF